MDYQEKLQDFFAFIEESVSPSHCVEAGIRRLQAAGFEELKMEDYWHAENGKKYYVNVRGTSLFAVSINRKFRYGQGFRMAGAHTDWPCFRVKPLADMKDARYFSHTSPTYGTPFQMIRAFGLSYRSAGENIAMGYATPAAVVEGWMNSAGHCANILNASYTQIGVGYVASGHYWTQMFIG